MRRSTLALVALLTLVFPATLALAFTNPSAAPPGGNITAPVNVGTVNQVKNANLGVNGLAVFGNTLLQGNSYLSWGITSGVNGYGLRDNAGTLEFRNSGGSWASIQSTVSALVGGAASWTLSGSNLYNNNTGNVGIGTTTPIGTLSVENGLGTATICLNGVCTTSLAQTSGYTGSFVAPGTTYTRSANNAIHAYGTFTVTPTLQFNVTNGLIVNTTAAGGTAVINDPRCGPDTRRCLGNSNTSGQNTATLLCTSVGYTLRSFNASFYAGAYGKANSDVTTMVNGDSSCTSSCNAITQVTCAL